MAFVGEPFTRADHNSLVRAHLASKIDHGLSDIGVATDSVSAGPEKQIARRQCIQFKSVVALCKHGLKVSSFAHPNVLLAGITRHVFDAALREDVINETGAIHSAVDWVGRSVFVPKILRRQVETKINHFLNFRRVVLRIRDLGH